MDDMVGGSTIFFTYFTKVKLGKERKVKERKYDKWNIKKLLFIGILLIRYF